MKNNFLSLKKKIQWQFGFTMIELLVVMFVIGLISTLVVVNYRSGQKTYILARTVQQLVSDVRKAQNMALSGYNPEEQNYNGYGVHIDEDDSYYIIYGDIDNNTTYQPSDILIETIYLPDNIGIQSVSPASGELHIFFEPPQPITYLNGNDGIGLFETVILELENSSLSKTVRITTAGSIQVE